jgi:Uma2 family endonuclease
MLTRPRTVEPLENGMRLSASAFLRRYEAMPELKKAELIQGMVYMGSPVRVDKHGRPDALLQTWLGVYAAATPGVEHATNATVRLGPDDVLQPDGFLRILRKSGGRSELDSKGYLDGAPELAVEIAASSASIDLHEKRDSYRKFGVREYVAWRTQENKLDWWTLQNDEFIRLEADAQGVLRSHVFPGLWLDLGAALKFDGSKLLATLQGGLATPDHAGFLKNPRRPRD